MNRSDKETDDLINFGVAAMRNQTTSTQQIEETASRVFQKLQFEYEKLLSGAESLVTETPGR